MHSPATACCGCSARATERQVMSRSVMIPTRIRVCWFLTTGITPQSCSTIRRDTAYRFESGVQQTGCCVIISFAFIALSSLSSIGPSLCPFASSRPEIVLSTLLLYGPRDEKTSPEWRIRSGALKTSREGEREQRPLFLHAVQMAEHRKLIACDQPDAVDQITPVAERKVTQMPAAVGVQCAVFLTVLPGDAPIELQNERAGTVHRTRVAEVIEQHVSKVVAAGVAAIPADSQARKPEGARPLAFPGKVDPGGDIGAARSRLEVLVFQVPRRVPQIVLPGRELQVQVEGREHFAMRGGRQLIDSAEAHVAKPVGRCGGLAGRLDMLIDEGQAGLQQEAVGHAVGKVQRRLVVDLVFERAGIVPGARLAERQVADACDEGAAGKRLGADALQGGSNGVGDTDGAGPRAPCRESHDDQHRGTRQKAGTDIAMSSQKCAHGKFVSIRVEGPIRAESAACR